MLSFRFSAPAAFLVALFAVGAQAPLLLAQVPRLPTIEACYVPLSGTVYRIDTPTSPAAGAPKGCLTSTHIKFLWNQQGVPGADGVKGDKGDKGDPGAGASLPRTSWNSLDLGGDDGWTSIGVYGRGNPLGVSGAGARAFWYPRKGAFRAGTVTGAQWDETNIGAGSFAVGDNPIATGAGSVAIGTGTSARGQTSTAFGAYSAASGTSSVAMGDNSTASGLYAVAIGERAEAPGRAAFASGRLTQSSGVGSTALGNGTVASGDASTASGFFTTASGRVSTVLGSLASSNGMAGAFVYGDASSAVTLNATVPNQFIVRAAGGFRFRSSGDLANGCDINPAGQLSCTGGVTGVSVGPDLSLTGQLQVGGTSTFAGALLANSTVEMAGGFVAKGFAALSIPNGAGTRFEWIPQNAALRVGAIDGSQWDANNIGDGSVALGRNGLASGTDAIAIGLNIAAAGTNSVALGHNLTASGNSSVAVGSNATTNGHRGALVFGDFSTNGQLVSTRDNEFLVRAAGGVTFYTNSINSVGVSVAPGGGSWQSVSDVRKKTAFRELDGEKILERLRAMPVRSWQYKSQSASIRHIGPTAQDFRAAFGVGESDTTITSVDADGVALAGVKALVVRTTRLAEENAELRARLMRAEHAVSANARLARELAALRVQMAALLGERTSPQIVRAGSRTR